MLRVAMLSVHTCPLAPLGGWETGGMNVYVRELCRGLGRLGVATDVFTRRQDPDVPTVVELGEHSRVIHLDAGAPRHRDKYAVLDDIPELACNIQRYRNHTGARPGPDRYISAASSTPIQIIWVPRSRRPAKTLVTAAPTPSR